MGEARRACRRGDLRLASWVGVVEVVLVLVDVDIVAVVVVVPQDTAEDSCPPGLADQHMAAAGLTDFDTVS